ncbi:MAG: hypothetical protein WA614_03390 [Acidimicrobiales bacterium]
MKRNALANTPTLWFASVDDDPHLYDMRRIRAEHPSQPETQGWWPIGQGVGYDASFTNQTADLAAAWPDSPRTPNFVDGAKVSAVCESMERSVRAGFRSRKCQADLTGCLRIRHTRR